MRTGPENVRESELITMDELRFIRKIWLNEKHEFDDSLPRIYKKVMGKEFEDNNVVKNKYYGHQEWDLLSEVCKDLYPDHELMLELQSGLLDIEARNSAISSTRNVLKNLEGKIKQSFYKNEEDAEELMRQRRSRRGIVDEDIEPDSEVNMDDPINTSPYGYEEEEC